MYLIYLLFTMCNITTIKKPDKRTGKDRLKAEIDLNLLLKIISIQSYSQDESRMSYFIKTELKRMKLDWTEDSLGNIYVTKGEAEHYPTIVAHIDTVHNIVEELKVYNTGPVLFAMNGGEQTGIGGDDKVGIYTCFHILKKYPAVKAVFFSREEIGCVGSGGCDLQFFTNSAYVMQCDRKGNTDFVSKASGTELHSTPFLEKIGNILPLCGYETYTWGGITDVATLKDRGLGVAAFNMSCGYWRPHTSTEVVDINDIGACVAVLEGIVNTIGCEKQEHTKPVYNRYYDEGYEWEEYYEGRYGSRMNYTPPQKPNLELSDSWCEVCGDKLYKDQWCSICRKSYKPVEISVVTFPKFEVKPETIKAFELNDEWEQALNLAIGGRLGKTKTVCCELQLTRDIYNHLYCAGCLEYLVYSDHFGAPTLDWDKSYWGNAY